MSISQHILISCQFMSKENSSFSVISGRSHSLRVSTALLTKTYIGHNQGSPPSAKYWWIWLNLVNSRANSHCVCKLHDNGIMMDLKCWLICTIDVSTNSILLKFTCNINRTNILVDLLLRIQLRLQSAILFYFLTN